MCMVTSEVNTGSIKYHCYCYCYCYWPWYWPWYWYRYSAQQFVISLKKSELQVLATPGPASLQSLPTGIPPRHQQKQASPWPETGKSVAKSMASISSTSLTTAAPDPNDMEQSFVLWSCRHSHQQQRTILMLLQHHQDCSSGLLPPNGPQQHLRSSWWTCRTLVRAAISHQS